MQRTNHDSEHVRRLYGWQKAKARTEQRSPTAVAPDKPAAGNGAGTPALTPHRDDSEIRSIPSHRDRRAPKVARVPKLAPRERPSPEENTARCRGSSAQPQ